MDYTHDLKRSKKLKELTVSDRIKILSAYEVQREDLLQTCLSLGKQYSTNTIFSVLLQNKQVLRDNTDPKNNLLRFLNVDHPTHKPSEDEKRGFGSYFGCISPDELKKQFVCREIGAIVAEYERCDKNPHNAQQKLKRYSSDLIKQVWNWTRIEYLTSTFSYPAEQISNVIKRRTHEGYYLSNPNENSIPFFNSQPPLCIAEIGCILHYTRVTHIDFEVMGSDRAKAYWITKDPELMRGYRQKGNALVALGAEDPSLDIEVNFGVSSFPFYKRYSKREYCVSSPLLTEADREDFLQWSKHDSYSLEEGAYLRLKTKTEIAQAAVEKAEQKEEAVRGYLQ